MLEPKRIRPIKSCTLGAWSPMALKVPQLEEILEKGGSAVDAAIATLFCEGVTMPQSMGIGGGFFMLIYSKECHSVVGLDAREAAPLHSTPRMFVEHPHYSVRGGLAVAVPGELAGYWEAHTRFGKLPWAELVHPAIELCRSGHTVTAYLARILRTQEQLLSNEPSLREVFVDPRTGSTYKEGQRIRRPQLARTLEMIASNGPQALYDGELTLGFVQDIQNHGGIVQVDDLHTYKAKWREPISLQLSNGQRLFTVPVPACGNILASILNILIEFLDETSALETTTNLHRIVEAFKFGYGKRSELGDPDFMDDDINNLLGHLPSTTYAAETRGKVRDDRTFSDPIYYGANYYSNVEDEGTAHISVIASNGDAVSVTSTINLLFGAGFRSPSTGIILNNEMDDFSSPSISNTFNIPPSPANYIAPGKRPMSSMCPSIIIDHNDNLRLVIGSAGGSKIVTTMTMVILRNLIYGESIAQAVNASRLHHQLIPMTLYFETEFNPDLVRSLEQLGHRVSVSSANIAFGSLTALEMRNGNVEGSFDPRRGGNVSYICSRY